jgi:hypothetical protein
MRRPRELIKRGGNGYRGSGTYGRQAVMITVEMLDGLKGRNPGVMVVRDGTLRGGELWRAGRDHRLQANCGPERQCWRGFTKSRCIRSMVRAAA